MNKYKKITNTQTDYKYLKTQGDQTFSKTQIALMTINNFDRQSKHSYAFFQNPYTSNRSDGRNAVHSILQENSEQRLNFFDKGIHYYKIDCREKIFPIRFHFKCIKNVINFYGSFSIMFPSPQSHEYRFLIDKQFHTSFIPKEQQKQKEYFYICLEAKHKIGTLRIKINFYQEILDRAKSYSNFKISNTKNIFNKTLGFTSKTQNKNKSIDLHQNNMKRKISTNSVNFIKKNHLQAQEYNQISSFKRHLLTQQSQEKNIIVKKRKEQFNQFKQKERLLKEKASQNKQLIKKKSYLMKKFNNDKELLTRSVYTLVKLSGLFKILQKRKDIYVKGIIKQQKIQRFTNMFIYNIKQKISKNSNKQARNRNEGHIKCTFNMLGKILQQKNESKLSKVLIKFFSPLRLALKMNQIMNCTTQFRRKIMKLQRYYKIKYQTRLFVIQKYSKNEINLMLNKYPNFNMLKSDFQKNQILLQLIKQYIRESNQKYIQTYIAWQKTQQQIQNMKFSNLESIKSNSSLKKYFQVIKTKEPLKKPYCRIFRDLSSLTGMIREWFQIELRKLLKKKNSKK